MEQHAKDMLLQMPTGGFLHTNVAEYLGKSGKEVTCISCNKCVRKNHHLLSYKYANRMGSVYTQQFQEPSPGKCQAFNLDRERRNFKIDFNPPRAFVTTSKDTFADQRGTKKVGDPSEKKSSRTPIVRRGKSNFHTGPTTYSLVYPNYGQVPKAHQHRPAHNMLLKQPLEQATSYKLTHSNVQGEAYKNFQVAHGKEKGRVDLYGKQQVRGTLTREEKLPFRGTTAAATEFAKPKVGARPGKIYPFNMLIVPHKLKMPMRTTAQLEFDAKHRQGHTD